MAKKTAKKKIAKKVPTRPAKKKTTKVAAKKRSPKRTSKQSSTRNAALINYDQLFKGKKVCLAGRFTYAPSKDQLIKFVEQRKGTIVDKVDGQLDLLIVGEGKQSAKQTKAEKLNGSGNATIEIVTDLSQLIFGLEADLARYLSDPKLVKSVASILDSSHWWLWGSHSSSLQQDGVDYSGLKLGGTKDKFVLQIPMKNCDFTGATLKNITLGESYAYQANGLDQCLFDRTKFDGVELANAKNCKVTNSTGTKVEFDGIELCRIEQTRINEVMLHHATDCEFFDCHFKSLGGNIIDYHEIDNSHFGDCKIDKWESKYPKFIKGELAYVEVGNWVSEQPMFEKSHLNGCRFKKGKADQIRFQDCKITDCTFENLECDVIDFCNSQVKKIQFKKCKIQTVHATEKQLAQITGLGKIEVPDVKKLKKLTKLAKTIHDSNKLKFEVMGTTDSDHKMKLTVDRDWNVEFKFQSIGGAKKFSKEKSLERWRHGPLKSPDVQRQLYWLFTTPGINDLDLTTLSVKTSKCPLKPKELKQLIIESVYETIGKEPKSEEELKAAQSQARKKNAADRKSILGELKNGDVNKINRRPTSEMEKAGPYRNAKLGGLNLSGIRLSKLNFGKTDFARSDLSKARLTGGKFVNADFSGANLAGADLRNTDLTGANFTDADLTGAKLKGSYLNQARFHNATLKKTVFGGKDCREAALLAGCDFRSANLDDCVMKNCGYDEKTRLPKGISTKTLKEMEWYGSGVPPHERRQNRKATGPIDFDQFMARLREITDASRLSKSLKMLKADRFELFSDVTNDEMVGVVKSQTDDSLVYSCSLNSEGEFACCTQNLNPCGGLRGALCKHILVLVVGLTKNGELDATQVDSWVNDSKLKNPNLDKDRMSEVLLKYKGAEAGEIDWRPTETVPEDFLSF